MGWLGDGSYRGQGRQVWTVVGIWKDCIKAALSVKKWRVTVNTYHYQQLYCNEIFTFCTLVLGYRVKTQFSSDQTSSQKFSQRRMVIGQMPDGACATAVHLCALAMPRQASHGHLILLRSTSFSRFTVPFCRPTETNFLALMTPEGMILKSNFLGVTLQTLFVGEGDPIPHNSPVGHKHPSTRTQTIMPLRSYDAPIAPQQEQTPVAFQSVNSVKALHINYC